MLFLNLDVQRNSDETVKSSVLHNEYLGLRNAQ